MNAARLLPPLPSVRNRQGVTKHVNSGKICAGSNRLCYQAVFQFTAVGAARLGSDYRVDTASCIPVASGDLRIAQSSVNYAGTKVGSDV
jgi:hypothetical protein